MEQSKARRSEAVFKRVLSRVAPNAKEAAKTAANAEMLTDRLKKIAPSSVKIVVTGSIAKGTDLSGSKDIDVFMLFDKRKPKEEIVKNGLAYAKKMVDPKGNERYEMRYAEHPYIRLYLDSLGIKADIVPALKIDNIEEMGTAVDRSPMHTEFVNKNLTAAQKGDVRLLKQFLKAHDLYGAELKIKGFSGYLCELLIYHYGSLLKLFERATDFKTPLYINPRNRQESHDQKMVKQFQSEFVVVDPVDPNRNVAAIVSKKALGRFVVLTRLFLESPSDGMFSKRTVDGKRSERELASFLKETGLQSFLIVTPIPDISEDITWPQLKKIRDGMLEQLERYGFGVYLAMPWVSGRKGLMLFLAPDNRIKTRFLKGPDALRTKATTAFIKKHNKAFGFEFRDSAINALERSRYETMGDALSDFLKRKVVKGRKDVKLSDAKLFVGRIPKEHQEQAYIEMRKRLDL